jgi:hypothetical protein
VGDQDGTETVDERMAAVEHQVEALLQVVASQAATIDALQREVADRPNAAEPAPTTASATTASATTNPTEPVVDRTMGRRRLLLGGATATAAAAAAVVAGSASPAAAANGGNAILGQVNSASAPTTLTFGGSSTNALNVNGTSTVALVEGNQSGSGTAVKGAAVQGSGIEGTSSEGSGVYGSSEFEVGVKGIGPFGVQGEGEIAGVQGITTGGTGVVGTATSGFGVYASSQFGTAVEANGPTALRLTSYSGRPAPVADGGYHDAGEVVYDDVGTAVWLCVASGTPGTWRKLGGPTTAGQFHVLPAPARIVDTRPGGVPTSVLPKTPLAAASTRVYDLKVNSSGVPAGATAALITVLLVNAANGNGNMTLWANGVAKPTANTMVWGAGAGRWTATAVSALDSQARVQVNVSAQTDLVLDVVGYYR